MNFFFRTIAFGLILQYSLFASEYEIFVGVDGGASWATFTDPQSSYTNKEIVTYGAKAGVVNKSDRMYVSYQYIDAFKDSPNREGQFQTLTANAEAFTDPWKPFSGMGIHIFVGGHLGALNVEMKAPFASTDKTALLYGAQIGLLIDFDLPISLETGYRYSWSSFSDYNTDLDRLQVAYGGLNISF